MNKKISGSESPIKKKLVKIVSDYKKVYPYNYWAVCEMVKSMRRNLVDQEFASVGEKGEERGVRRQLYEISEILADLIKSNLTEEEMKEFYFDHPKSLDLQRWFANKFPEFRLAEKI